MIQAFPESTSKIKALCATRNNVSPEEGQRDARLALLARNVGVEVDLVEEILTDRKGNLRLNWSKKLEQSLETLKHDGMLRKFSRQPDPAWFKDGKLVVWRARQMVSNPFDDNNI